MVGIVAVTWKFSAEREVWARKPEPGEWHPSRLYVEPPHFPPRSDFLRLDGSYVHELIFLIAGQSS